MRKLVKRNYGTLYSNRNNCPFISEIWDIEGNDISGHNQFSFKENYIKDDEELPF